MKPIYYLNSSLAISYVSQSQKIRVMTESWVEEYGFCPNCGNPLIKSRANNPVGDFTCSKCNEEYELKSKHFSFGKKITDGAYGTMISRLNSDTNPSFFGLTYSKNLEITNLFVIPKFYFTHKIIEKRKPLSSTARRAGWTGCNILLNLIPESGKIYYIQNGESRDKSDVLKDWKKTHFLSEESNLSAKGWLIDVIGCIELLGKQEFTLQDLYNFTGILQEKYQGNNNIEAKIRQQLQLLRNNGYLDFIGRGKYKLC
ncbi:MAG: DpnI domain-containing protein [Candidatus Gracilibacteria bacterium]